MTLPLIPLAAQPAGAAPGPYTLDMIDGGGTLELRDAEEPYLLEQTTSIIGTIDGTTGEITGSRLVTPTVSFEQQITSPLSATVFIDATFSQVTPNSATGSIDSQGQMLIQDQLAVDLDVEVVPTGSTTPLTLPGECRAAPIALTLDSTSDYDPETDLVTLSDGDFSVPPVEETEDCAGEIADAINDQLAGGGHSLTLTLFGELPQPEPPGCETTTELTVAPADESRLGDPVTLTATVATVVEDPECIEAANNSVPLAGVVDFRDGNDLLGNVTLESDGTAEITTSALPAGTRTLSAEFRPNATFGGSEDATSYLVAATPAISANLPPFVGIGGDPAPFDLTVTNTGFGSALEDVRVDVTIRRPTGQTAALTPDRVLLEQHDGTDWVPVALTEGPAGKLLGTIGAVGDFDAPVDDEVTRPLRISFGPTGSPEVSPGPVEVVFELVDGESAPVVAPAPDALASSVGTTSMIEDDRRASTVVPGLAALGGPVSPHTIRQGNTAVLPSLRVDPNLNGVRPGGYLEVSVNGRPIDAATASQVITPGYRPQVTFTGGLVGTLIVPLPPDLGPGTHQMTVTYSGDNVFLPSQVTVPVTVVAPLGRLYDCKAPSSPDFRFTTNVVAQANVPATGEAGSPVALNNLDVRLLVDRGSHTTGVVFSGRINNAATTTVGSPTLEGIDFAFGPGGAGSATAVERTGGVRMPAAPNPATDIDHIFDFKGETGSLALEGELGETVPVTLDSIVVSTRTTAGGIPVVYTCVPVGDAIRLGDVTIAGTTLAVNPSGTVREGKEVTLTAAVAPAGSTGVVEFRDGNQTIGVVPVANGAASMTTDDLPVGTRSLTARYFQGMLAPALTSAPVELEVEATDCAPFANPGNGAAVRLAYMELLRRCPDQSGYDYWTEELDEARLTREEFATRISDSLEARKVIVDDAYQLMLERPAEESGKLFWAERLRTNAGYDDLLAELGASPEFWELAGETDEGFVTRAYERIIGRTPEAGGLTFWTDYLGARDRRQLVRALVRLDEPVAALVTRAYREILDRDPTPTELAAASAAFRADFDRSALYAKLVGTSAFFQRAQEFPNFD